VSGEVPVIGMVGKLSPEKGADFLLQAAGSLVGRWPSLQVILVGDGDAQGRCRDDLARVADAVGLGERVRFLGYVPEAGCRFHEFDILAVPSHAESFGLVTLEAMAHGVPVIATATGGSPEIIRDGREGFLVPPGDVEALAGRLGQLLACPGLRREMGRLGRARFERRYTAGIMVARTEAVYLQALGRARQARLTARG
jgi:glycosyltransferase involved in cell wall biosynthesis